MDRGGKWYKRDWWTHYSNKVNVYGHKDRLNNRLALLEEQKEIRKKEREKLNEFIYGKKIKNNSLNLSINDGESIKEQINKIEIKSNMNETAITEYNDMGRPGLGMKSQINLKDNESILLNDKIFDNKNVNNEKLFIGKKTKNINEDSMKLDNEHKDKKKHSHHHRHHHGHHHHSHHSNKEEKKYKSRSRSGNRSRSRNKDNIKKSTKKNYE